MNISLIKELNILYELNNILKMYKRENRDGLMVVIEYWMIENIDDNAEEK